MSARILMITPARQTGIRLLIVEDEQPIRELLQFMATEYKYASATAGSGEEALDILKKHAFDIMLTDIILGRGISGLELARKAKELHQDMIVVVMTGFVDKWTYDDVVACGASDFIKKPFTIAEVAARLAHVRELELFKRLSITDELTGILNRRGFFSKAEQYLQTAGHNGKICAVYLDVDGLKEINDRFGHDAGDEAIQETARVLKQSFRSSDIVARMGGDEFAAIPLRATEETISMISERLETNIREAREVPGRRFTFSVSYGIALFDAGTISSVDEILTLADRNMLLQKTSKKHSDDRPLREPDGS